MPVGYEEDPPSCQPCCQPCTCPSPLPPSSQVVVAVVPVRRLDGPLHIRLLLLLLLHEVWLGRPHPGTPPPPYCFCYYCPRLATWPPPAHFVC